MGIEKFRNNHIYESNLYAPLELIRSDKVNCKEDYLNQLTVIGDKLVGLCQPGYLFCEDIISGELLWYLNADEGVDILACHQETMKYRNTARTKPARRAISSGISRMGD